MNNIKFYLKKIQIVPFILIVKGYQQLISPLLLIIHKSQALWGAISGAAYFWIVYEIWLGGAKKLAEAAGGDVLSAHKILCWFVLVGWAIYPVGYMAGTEGWYSGIFGGLDMDVIYNIGDAINKIGFGLVIYSLAVKKQA